MKTNFDMCCESVEAMAQIIDIIKCGWTKEQIFKEILPVLNAITEDVERYREYILSELGFSGGRDETENT